MVVRYGKDPRTEGRGGVEALDVQFLWWVELACNSGVVQTWRSPGVCVWRSRTRVSSCFHFLLCHERQFLPPGRVGHCAFIPGTTVWLLFTFHDRWSVRVQRKTCECWCGVSGISYARPLLVQVFTLSGFDVFILRTVITSQRSKMPELHPQV